MIHPKVWQIETKHRVSERDDDIGITTPGNIFR